MHITSRDSHQYGGQRAPIRCSSASWFSRTNPNPFAPKYDSAVEVLVRGPVGQQVAVGLTRVERRLPQLVDPCGRHGLGNLGVGAERRGTLLEQEVHPHVRRGRDPHAVDVLGAAGLVVEMAGSGVAGSAVGAAVLQQVDERERVGEVAVAEHQVLVELDATLTVEVDVEQLPAVQRLADAVHEVQPGHLLVSGLRVDADQLGVGKRLDERQRVPDGRQQDVAARFVGLRLDREAQRIAVVGDVLAEQIKRLAVAREGGLDVLGAVVLAALPAAPQDEGLRAEFGGEIDVAQHLAQREAAHAAVVAGESAVLEDRLGEQVRRHHRHGHPGGFQCRREPADRPLPLTVRTTEREQVVIVEGQAVCAQFGQPFDGLDHVDRGTGRDAERIGAGPPHGPQAEGELVRRLAEPGRLAAGMRDSTTDISASSRC